MARVTALQAYHRTRSKKDQTKNKTGASGSSNQLNRHGKVFRQIPSYLKSKRPKTPIEPASSPIPSSSTVSIVPKNNLSIPADQKETKPRANLSNKRTRRKKSSENSKKITDYFSYVSCENIPECNPFVTSNGIKSSPKYIQNINSTNSNIFAQRSNNTNDVTSRDLNGNDIVTVTISDTEDDDESKVEQNNTDQVGNKSMINYQPSINIIPRLEGLSLTGLSISFSQNVKTEDEDLEIIDFLPPIPLRDHQVHELED